MNRNIPTGAVPYRMTSSQSMYLSPSSSSVLVRRQMPIVTEIASRSTLYRQHPAVAAYSAPTVRASFGGVMKRTSRPLPYKVSSRSCETTALAIRDYQHGSVSRPQVLTPVVRREPERTHSSMEQAQGISSAAIGREKYPYMASSDIIKKEDMLYMMTSDASRKQKLAYSAPSNMRTEKSAYLGTSNMRTEKSAYSAPSNMRTEQSAYFAPSDANKREKSAYFAASDANKRVKPTYLAQSDSTRREKAAYLSPNDAGKTNTVKYMAPGDVSRRKTYTSPSDTSRRDKTYPSETSRKPKTFMANRNDTSQKKTPVILGSKFRYKGTKKLQDLYVVDSIGGRKTNTSEVKPKKPDSPPSGNIDVPHFLQYDGKSQWSAFHMKFQIYARRQYWKGSELLDRLCFCLTDAASEYFASCLEKNPRIAYKDLIEKFKSKFDKEVKKEKAKKKSKPSKSRMPSGLYKEEGNKKQASQRCVQQEPSRYGKGREPDLESERVDHSRFEERSRLSSAGGRDRKFTSSSRTYSSASQFVDSHPRTWKFPKDQTAFGDDNAEDRYPVIGRSRDDIHPDIGSRDDIHPVIGRPCDDIHPNIGRPRDDIRPGKGRSRDDIHPDIGRSRDAVHQGIGRSHDDIHPDIGRSRDYIHPGKGRSRDDIHPDTGRSCDDVCQGIGRSHDDIHPNIGRSRDYIHPGKGRSRDDIHPDIGRSRDDIHPDIRRSRDDIRQGIGRSRDDVCQGIGRSRDDIQPDIGRSRDDVHQGIGRSRDDIQPDTGRSRDDVCQGIGRSHDDIHPDIGRSRDEIHNSARSGYNRSSSTGVERPQSTEWMSYGNNDDPSSWKVGDKQSPHLYSKQSGLNYRTPAARSSKEKNGARLPQGRKRSYSPKSHKGHCGSHSVSGHRDSEERGRPREKKSSQGIVQDRHEPLYTVPHRSWSPEARERDEHLGRRNGSMDREYTRQMSEHYGGQYNERSNTTNPNDGMSHSARHFDRTENPTLGEYHIRELDPDGRHHTHATPQEAFRTYDGASGSRASGRSSHTANASAELWERIGLERSARKSKQAQLLTKSRARHSGVSDTRVQMKAGRSTGTLHTEKKFKASMNKAKRVANKYASLDTARRERDNLKRVVPGQTRQHVDQDGITVQSKAPNGRYSSMPQRKYFKGNERRIDVSSGDRQTHYTARANPPQNIVVTLIKKGPAGRRGQTRYHSTTTYKDKFSRKHMFKIPAMSKTGRKVLHNPRVGLLDKKNKKMHICIVDGCDARTANPRIHVMLNHFPQCFHDDYFKSRLPQVVACLHWLCEELLGKDSTLINLMDYVNDMDLLAMNNELGIAELEQVMLMCEPLSVASLPKFNLKPMNSIALLCNWRVVASLINLLEEEEKTHFKRMSNLLHSAHFQTLGTAGCKSSATKQGGKEVERTPVRKAPRNRTPSAVGHRTDSITGPNYSSRIEGTRSKPNRGEVAHTTHIQSRWYERTRQPVSSKHRLKTNWHSLQQRRTNRSYTEQSFVSRKISKSYQDRKRMMSDNSAVTTPWTAKKMRVSPKPSSQSKSNRHQIPKEHSRKLGKSESEGIDLSEFQVIDDVDDTSPPTAGVSRMKPPSREKAVPMTKSKGKTHDHKIQSAQARRSTRYMDRTTTRRQQRLASSAVKYLEDEKDRDSFVVLDEEIEDEDSTHAVADGIGEHVEDTSFVVVDDVTSNVMDKFSVVDEVENVPSVPSPDGYDDISQFSVVDEA